MATKPKAIYLYTETRLNLDPAYSSALVTLHTSSSSSPSSEPLTHDEATFSRYNLATDASIFFRRANSSPRSFLWRLLDHRKLLEIQAVDLIQAANEKTEALLTVRLHFPHSIRPYGIAFGDPDDRDAIVVFALTLQNELYTINLHKDIFVHSKASEALPPDWCVTFSPPALRIREPYRLFASQSNQLLLSLTDGGILQLDGTHHEQGLQWVETYFSAPGWGVSLPRKIAKWRGESFITYGDTELDSTTAASLVLSPDEEHIITVCLNHTLRIWNIETGKIVLQTDILELDPAPVQPTPKTLLGPSQRQLLQVIDTPGQDGDQYYIVTFSPKSHQFAFWAVIDIDSGFEGIRRIQPEFEFTPPIEDLMDTSSWNLEEFYVRTNRGWTDTQLWIRARAGPISRVFKVQFSLFDDIDGLEESWRTEWTAIAIGRQATEYLNQRVPVAQQSGDANLHCPSVTEKWFEFLFYPGRFTSATLETALHVYSKGSHPSHNQDSKARGSLQERISAAILTKATTPGISSGLDFKVQELQLSDQYHIFYGLVQDLQKRRSNTLAFVLDMDDRLPWIVSSDMVSPIRTCTDLDICDFHRSTEKNVPSEEAVAKKLETTYEVLDLLHVANVFRSLLTPAFQDKLSRRVLSEILEEPSTSVQDRMLAFYEESDLAAAVSQEDWDRFRGVLDEVGGFDVLDFNNFISILEQLEQRSEGKTHDEQITRYGARALIRTSQETLMLNLNTLLDLLSLAIFIEGEISGEELQQSMQSAWRGQDIFIEVLVKLKEHAVLDFLMRNLRIERTQKSHRSTIEDSPSSLRSSQQSQTTKIEYTITLMESLFIGDWSLINYRENAELPELIAYWARRWTSSRDLSTQYNGFTEHVFADLIKHNDEQLCVEFMPYVPSTVWASYLKGRLYLARGDYDMAAISFRKAAYGLSVSDFKVSESDTARLLRPDEQEYFSSGLSSFYEHIMDLFGNLKSFSYVVDFAQVAIQHNEMNLLASEKRHTKSSKTTTSNDVRKSAQLLSRLFNAALDSAQYEIAYSALTRIPDTSIRRASLPSLATTLVNHQRAEILLSLPFTGLAGDLDTVLSNIAHKSLSSSSSEPSSVFFRTLYALRIQRSDFHGAAQCLWDYLQRIKGSQDSTVVIDPQDDRISELYLLVINALRCSGADEGWVLDDPIGYAGSPGAVKFTARLSGVEEAKKPGKKRRVLFLVDIRKEYQELLDQISDLEGGRFAFGAEQDVMDIL